MGEINRALGSSGGGITVEALGETWTVSYINQRMKGQMESWLENRARQKLIACKDDLDPTDYEERMDLQEQNIAAGVYSYDGKPMKKALHSAITGSAGIYQLLKVLMKPSHPDLTNQDIEQLLEKEEDGLAFVAALKESLQVRALDPNQAKGKEKMTPTPTMNGAMKEKALVE